MRSSALIVRAAIFSAAVAGCCSPSPLGTQIVPVTPKKLDEFRASYKAGEKHRARPSTQEEEDLAVCKMVCADRTISGSGASKCRMLPLRFPVTFAKETGEPEPDGEPEPQLTTDGDDGSNGGVRPLPEVAKDPFTGVAPEAPPAKPEETTTMAAECEMWRYPICGRRPEDWQPPRRPDCHGEIGAYLALSARLEADSVQSFQDLAANLARFSAPIGLIERARRAALDERRHARSMAEAAEKHGAKVPPPERAPEKGPTDLEAFAEHNAVEGCVVETFGAALAHRSAMMAEDPEIRGRFERIAEDETRHAALSWDIFRWAQGRLSPKARTRILARQRRALKSLCTSPPLAPLGARAALGLPNEAEALAMAQTLARALRA